MERKVKSFRLRTDLLAWVESEALARKVTQIAVLEQALEGAMRVDAGQPPVVVAPKPVAWKPDPNQATPAPSLLGERQRWLAKEMGWNK